MGWRYAFVAQGSHYLNDQQATALVHRKKYFPLMHHTEFSGKNGVVVLEGQGFDIYGEGEDVEGYKKESEIDWVDYGAISGPGDTPLWESDDVFESNRRKETKGGMEHASEAVEDRFKTFMKGVDLERAEYRYTDGLHDRPRPNPADIFKPGTLNLDETLFEGEKVGPDLEIIKDEEGDVERSEFVEISKRSVQEAGVEVEEDDECFRGFEADAERGGLDDSDPRPSCES
jgi:hypothetical protein